MLDKHTHTHFNTLQFQTISHNDITIYTRLIIIIIIMMMMTITIPD